jgi:hypothetical protein
MLAQDKQVTEDLEFVARQAREWQGMVALQKRWARQRPRKLLPGRCLGSDDFSGQRPASIATE